MKQHLFVGALVGALVAGVGYTYAAAQQAEKGAGGKAAAQGEGHTTPKTQPETAPPPTAPSGDIALGTIHIPKAVKADGKPLPAGTYTVRLTSQNASQEAKGETPGLERWAEFLQRGQVKGREVATIIPRPEVSQVQKDSPPAPNAAKVETLKGGEYIRVWINKDGNQYLVHLPTT